MALVFLIASGCFLRLRVARKSLPKACSGYFLRVRFPPKRRHASSRVSLPRRVTSRPTSRSSSTGRSFLRLFCSHRKLRLWVRLSPSIHPMTQLGIGVAALNHDSVFQKAYESGIKKTEYWTYTLEDCLTLIARLPALAARIYRNVYRQGAAAPAIDKELDLVGNYTALMGYGANKDLTEYLRLYISIHGDHEGGNASAHTARTPSL